MASAEEQKLICDAIIGAAEHTPFTKVDGGLDQLTWTSPVEALQGAIAAFRAQQQQGNEVPTGAVVKHVTEEVVPPLNGLARGTDSDALRSAQKQFGTVTNENMDGVREAITHRNGDIEEIVTVLNGIINALTPARVNNAREHVDAARSNRASGIGNVQIYRATL